MKFNWWLSVAWGITLLFAYVSFGVYHEQAHVQINAYYGVDSEVDYFGYFPGFATVQTNSSQVCNEECNFLHSINEVVGYPLSIILIVGSMGIFFLLMKKNEKEEREEVYEDEGY